MHKAGVRPQEAHIDSRYRGRRAELCRRNNKMLSSIAQVLLTAIKVVTLLSSMKSMALLLIYRRTRARDANT